MKTRQTQSKQKIKDALIKLLLQKDFDKISVADITREAKVNRGTFYLHYIDKFDLIDKLLYQFKSELFSTLADTETQEKEALEKALCYLKENKDFIYTLSQSKASDLQNEIERFLKELLSRNANLRSDIVNTLHFSQEYASTTFFGSITSIVVYWIGHDFQESPDELSSMMITIRQLFSGQI